MAYKLFYAFIQNYVIHTHNRGTFNILIVVEIEIYSFEVLKSVILCT